VNKRFSGKVLALLPELLSWQSKLHVLQSLPYLDIPSKDKRKLECFLKQALADKNKFVRAWAYNGFYVLSRQYSEYEEYAAQIIGLAMQDEAPSVKARIRNIMKQGF